MEKSDSPALPFSLAFARGNRIVFQSPESVSAERIELLAA
jgi:hypothetical protein